MNSSGIGRDVHPLMLFIQHFLCRPRRYPPPQSVLKDGCGETVVACVMPKSCWFPSLGSCRNHVSVKFQQSELDLKMKFFKQTARVSSDY